MTRMDFEGSLHYTIITASSGIAFLETQVLSDGAKTAQYKDKLGSVYGGASAKTWLELLIYYFTHYCHIHAVTQHTLLVFYNYYSFCNQSIVSIKLNNISTCF
ncbi:hypothetical protein BH23BAC2_BH23BAC2_26130 [soil metagenome]